MNNKVITQSGKKKSLPAPPAPSKKDPRQQRPVPDKNINNEVTKQDLQALQKQIDDEMKLAQASQVNGTPTMFLNGKRVTNRTPEGIKQMIDEALKPKS